MSCSCNDIYTCHAELVHAYGDIQFVEITFTAQDWRGENYLKIMPCTVTGPNEIGPHTLPRRTHSVTVHKHLGSEVYKTVEVTIFIDRTTGVITFWKTSRTPAFSGRVEVR